MLSKNFLSLNKELPHGVNVLNKLQTTKYITKKVKWQCHTLHNTSGGCLYKSFNLNN